MKFEYEFWSSTDFHPKKNIFKNLNHSSTLFVDEDKKGLLTFQNETDTAKAQVMMVDGNFTLWTICETSKLYSILLGRDRLANATVQVRKTFEILENEIGLKIDEYKQMCDAVRISSVRFKVAVMSTISLIMGAVLISIRFD